MCDYSLHAVASRPAQVGEALVTTVFRGTITRGLAAEHDCTTAVCLRPGTEVAFTRKAKAEGWLWFWPKRIGSNVATFCQVNLDRPDVHHDAFRFSNGEIVRVNDLLPGQCVKVLQLPVNETSPKSEGHLTITIPVATMPAPVRSWLAPSETTI
ncbi:MAG TPA: hypothetical protein VMU25_02050 [Candidatus Paceibacterota bacterium]|nr:hypothetical protein [Candidatus Paceibacterota bacterium]